ncbi:MAG: beta-lactamase family protein, partial [Candidatus Eremiobacteraeota bacterium]|nr:beta-lactamase family protein [Candidatus Eremiobacteraeota bacterium]
MLKRYFCAAFLLIACFLQRATGDAAPPRLTPEQMQRIDAAMTAVIARERIAGMSIGVARNGAIMYARGYGYRDAGLKHTSEATTIYQVGSLTKQFTAAAVLMLVRDGKLSLDAPLRVAIPEYVKGGLVTVRELLTQTSGIADYTPAPSQSPSQILKTVQENELHFKPGERFEYSNTNYLLLGMMIERVSGVPYGEYIRTHIILPLHLTATSYTDLSKTAGNLAQGTAYTEHGFVPASVPSMSGVFSAGALSSNVIDLSTWDAALWQGRVVPRNLATLMMTQQMLPDGAGSGYGMGLMISKIYGRTVVMHTGAIDGFSTFSGTVANTGTEITVLTNTSNVDTIAIAKSLIGIITPPTQSELRASEFRPAKNEDLAVTTRLKTLIAEIASGTLDRSELTDSFSRYLTDEKLKPGVAYLASLGPP